MYELYDYQKINVERMRQILDENNFCLNLSKMGTGKTVVATALAISSTFAHVLIISAPTVLNQNWVPWLRRCDLDYELITINTLRGKKNTTLSHPYLIRNDPPMSDVSYEATKCWMDRCAAGMLVIVDEMQICKNENLSTSALTALLRPIIDGKGSSKILLMSGTPVDNEDQIATYLKILGQDHESNHSIDYFTGPFMARYGATMPGDAQAMEQEFRGYYSYYKIGPLNLVGDVKSQLQALEMAKVGIFAQLAKRALSGDGNTKVIVGLYFIRSIERLQTMMRGYGGATIIGATKRAERTKILEAFQRPDTKSRLLIANVDIIKEGINLGDEDGRFPRICYVNNGYIPLQQLIYRFIRTNTRSAAQLHIVVCEDIDERQLIESQHRRCAVIEQFTDCINPSNFDIIHHG